jgi:hypothetical protein
MEPVKITLGIEGGIIQWAQVSHDIVSIDVIDFDTEGMDDTVNIRTEGGTIREASVYGVQAYVGNHDFPEVEEEKENEAELFTQKVRLIAEYMGKWNVHEEEGRHVCSNCGHEYSAMMGEDEIPLIHSDCWPDIITLAKYHTSWDWLMPVVKKINTYALESMTVDEFCNYKEIWRMIYSPTQYDIELVFEQVAQFLSLTPMNNE